MSGNAYTLPESELERLLAEDAPCGDATTFPLGIGDRPGRLVFRARQAMIVCASEEARRVRAQTGREYDVLLAVEDDLLYLTVNDILERPRRLLGLCEYHIWGPVNGDILHRLTYYQFL